MTHRTEHQYAHRIASSGSFRVGPILVVNALVLVGVVGLVVFATFPSVFLGLVVGLLAAPTRRVVTDRWRRRRRRDATPERAASLTH